MARRPLSKRTRFEVFKRDSFRCQYCGRTPPDAILEVDHVIPVSSGGENDLLNLITSCFDCNRGKSDRHLSAVPPSIPEQLKEARARAEQIAEYNEFLLSQRDLEEETLHELGLYWCNNVYPQKDKFVFGDARRVSVKQFLKLLPTAEIYDAIDIAFAKFPTINSGKEHKQTWRYFCGICWNKIRDRQKG